MFYFKVALNEVKGPYFLRFKRSVKTIYYFLHSYILFEFDYTQFNKMFIWPFNFLIGTYTILNLTLVLFRKNITK